MIDSHVHFWDPSVLRYPWLGRGARPCRRAFRPSRLPRPFTSGEVDAAVFVEANPRPWISQRTRWGGLDALAEAEPRIAGIVAFVDLLDEARRDAALARLTRTPRVLGVRHNIQHQPSGFRTAARLRPRRPGSSARRGGPSTCASRRTSSTRSSRRLREAVPRCQATCSTTAGSPRSATTRTSHGRRTSSDWRRMTASSCKISGLLTEARDEPAHYGCTRSAGSTGHETASAPPVCSMAPIGR